MDRKAGKLSAERIAALDALGFVWNARQTGSNQGPSRVPGATRAATTVDMTAA
jgi:hypothetical protein